MLPKCDPPHPHRQSSSELRLLISPNRWALLAQSCCVAQIAKGLELKPKVEGRGGRGLLILTMFS